MKENFSKKMFLLASAVMLACTSSACGKSYSGGETVEVDMGEFTVPMYTSYKLSEEDSSDTLKMYENPKTDTVIAINTSPANSASLDAYVEFFKELILETPDGKDADIITEKCSLGEMTECCYLSYSFIADGSDATSCSYIIYSNNNVLTLTENKPGKSEETIKKELTALAEQAKYKGEYILPEENQYPYTVTSSFASASINEGLICSNASKVEDGAAASNNDNSIKIRLRKTDSYDRGALSKLEISLSYNQTDSPMEQAQNSFENIKNKDDRKNAVYLEASYKDIFPGCPSEMEDIQVYKESSTMILKNLSQEYLDVVSCYFEYNGNIYVVRMTYFDGDEEVKTAFEEQMKNVTIIQ